MNKSMKEWPPTSKETAVKLHSLLKLDNTNWHQLKNDSERRAAEMLSGAIVQLLSGNRTSEAIELLQQSMRWLKQEIKGPRCPGN